ncbi:putative transcription factor interactor and regulator CCHC(Zn) family [Helianthus annuus]|nr:putative transcription factor interactor and regulator CCHC(Zn) family [Helianthus annuus]KAJ0690420.1 putative transcription factor interactor and regulator CCHC(Zn) family [Helianthus annuus]
MIRNKKALLKKEFDLFTSLPGEGTKKLIERYCHLVRSMSLLDINKEREEWVDKLADALPQKEWGTFLMILKNTGEYDGLTISQFIEKIEGQDLEQQKIARMNNPSGQQDIKMYYKGSVQDAELSPKVQTAFSAENSSGSVNQSSIAKDHMALLATVLESYEGLVAGRIGNPMLTKEDYDQIDAEEMELMDIKWCLASVLRRAEKFKMITGRDDFRDANVSTLGFDKSKVTCFRCMEKGHFKRECTNREASGATNLFGNNDYYQKAIYLQVAQQPFQQQSSSSNAKQFEDGKKKMIEEANKKAYYDIIDQDDEKVAEGFSWDKYVPPNTKLGAFIAQIVQEPNLMKEWMGMFASDGKNQNGESVSSDDSSEKITVFDQSSSDSSDDEEETQINIGKSVLSPESFEFYFADRLKKLKEKRAAKEKRMVKCESVVQEKDSEQSKEVKVVEQCEEKDEKLCELDKMKEKLLFDLNYVKESYDVLNRTVNGLQKTNSEREDALNMMNAVMMTKQKAINHYIEECAKLKQELETEKIENERIRRLLQSYSSSDYLIDRIYPTVAGFEVFQDKKSEKKDTGKKQSVSYNKCPPPIWEGYSPRKPNEEQVKKAVNIKLKSKITDELPENIGITFTSSDTDHESVLIKKVVDQVLDKDEESESKSESGSLSLSVNSLKSSAKRVYSKEFLLSKSNLNDESIKVAYTLKDSDKLYYDEEFPIRSVQIEKIKKVFKLT